MTLMQIRKYAVMIKYRVYSLVQELIADTYCGGLRTNIHFREAEELRELEVYPKFDAVQELGKWSSAGSIPRSHRRRILNVCAMGRDLCGFRTIMWISTPLSSRLRHEGCGGKMAWGEDWFGIEWQYEPLTNSAMVKPGTRRLSDITNWEEELEFPDLNAIDWQKNYDEEYKGKISTGRPTMFVIVNGLF